MFELSLGAMSEPIGKQLPQLDSKEAERLQSHVDATLLLLLSGYITTAQKNKILGTLAKNVQKAISSQAQRNNDGTHVRPKLETRMTHTIRDKEYPHRIWVERDEETNEKRWFSCKGMGVEYVRADLAPSVTPPKPEADRDR